MTSKMHISKLETSKEDNKPEFKVVLLDKEIKNEYVKDFTLFKLVLIIKGFSLQK